MTALTEGQHPGEFVQSLAPGNRSVEKVTIKTAETLVPGEVLARELTAATVTSAAGAGNTGDGVMGTITPSALAREGVYQLIVEGGSTGVEAFVVYDPDGVAIGKGAVGSAFSAGGLAFTLADGSQDFVVGDRIVITVTQATEVWKALPNDGTLPAEGISWGEYGSASATVAGAIVARDAEVNDAELTWPTGISAANKDLAKTQLATRGIIVR